MPSASNFLNLIRRNAFAVDKLTADSSWLDECLPQLKNSQLVLIGEASHGTHDFYRMRSEISKRLIAEAGFAAVAIEADWPDAYRVNRYVKGANRDFDSESALGGFKRFPTWMWRNADVLDFVGWLRAYNDNRPAAAPKCGLYGLDLYSLYTSMEVVTEYLEKLDPEAAKKARYRYSCFDQFAKDAQTYGYSAGFGISQSCEREVVEQLIDFQRKIPRYLKLDGSKAEDDLFYIEQNALVVKNAEEYYRTMFRGRVASWNLRDQHMVETLNRLVDHLAKRIKQPKVILWAHNSHLGDARATEMGEYGELNVGELVRRQHGDKAFLIGFTTYRGTVTAASDWNAPAERMRVREALPHSYERLFHETSIPRFVLNWRGDDLLKHALKGPYLERAIGVIYRPDTERQSHYFSAQLSDQFDAVFHFDESRAVEPLERTSGWEAGEAPETYPSAV